MAGTAAGAAAPASLAARTVDAADTAGKAISGAATTAAVDAATSTPNAAAGGANKGTNAGASASTGATAQTASAAAAPGVVAAATPGAVAAAAGTVDDSDGTDSSSSDDSPMPAGATPESPATALAAMPVPGPVASPAAVASAQTASALADIGPVSKASHSGTGDSSVPDTGGGGAAGVAQSSTSTTTGTDPAPTPTLKVSQPVDTPEFAQGLADGVSMMVGSNLTSAKLQVNPAQLGPIDVRITVQGDQAQVSLTAHSAVTRDALESSSSKLREMLGAQGFTQVNVDISQRSFQERSTYAQPYDWTPSANGSAASASVATASTSRASSSLLDAYA
jgi:flagellar hook-length control protein FliK